MLWLISIGGDATDIGENDDPYDMDDVDIAAAPAGSADDGRPKSDDDVVVDDDDDDDDVDVVPSEDDGNGCVRGAKGDCFGLLATSLQLLPLRALVFMASSMQAASSTSLSSGCCCCCCWCC